MKLNKRIIKVMVSVCALFLVTVVYLTYFTVFNADEIVKSSYNQRVWKKEEKILRGYITDRNGTVLAKSKMTKNGQKREYPFGELYAHTIGYNSRTYGKTNIELKYNDYLLKTESVIDVLKREKSQRDFNMGANLELTLDNGMTKLAAELMGKSAGGVVCLNPVTGEVYCLYSNPSFDPNESELSENWEDLVQNENSPFISRATQGLYAPGSTFKIITAAAAVENGYEDFTVNDEGKIKIDGMQIRNSGERVLGMLDLSGALKSSSNVYFSALSQKIGQEKLEEMINDFCITKKLAFDTETKASKISLSKADGAALAATAIGQGKLLTTPLHMALTASAVANGGVMMKPYIVERAFFESGNEIYNAKAQVLSKPIKRSTAKLIEEGMIQCVQSGTGTAARVSGITVAGKTGTAENEKKNKTHAWFVCYAPAENPQIAICVMKEYSGSGGGSVCAPVAARLIRYAKENGLVN